jgi:ferredoxin
MSKDTSVLVGDLSKKSPILIQSSHPPHTSSVFIQLHDGQRVAYTSGSQETILETLLDAGVEASYSCQSGVCMSCMAEVEEGCVVMDEAFCLSEDDIKEKKALMCQSRPASEHIKIKFLE